MYSCTAESLHNPTKHSEDLLLNEMSNHTSGTPSEQDAISMDHNMEHILGLVPNTHVLAFGALTLSPVLSKPCKHRLSLQEHVLLVRSLAREPQ